MAEIKSRLTPEILLGKDARPDLPETTLPASGIATKLTPEMLLAIKPSPTVKSELSGTATNVAGIGVISELDDSGMPDTLTRGYIAAADTNKEKYAAFKLNYPNGEMKAVPSSVLYGEAGDPVIFYRPDEKSEYRYLDAPEFHPIDNPAEVGRDIVEAVAPVIGATAGEFVSIASTAKAAAKAAAANVPVVRGSTVIGGLIRGAFAAAGGEVVQETLEGWAGFGGDETPLEISNRAATEGAIALFGGAIIDGIGRPIVNIIRGTAFRAKPGSKEAMESAYRLRLPNLPLHAIADSPLIQRLAMRSQALTGGLSRYIRDIEMSLSDLAANHGTKIMEGFNELPGMDYLVNLSRSENRRMRNALLKYAKRNKANLGKKDSLGADFKKDFSAWNSRMKGAIEAMYIRAKQSGVPDLDITELQNKARVALGELDIAGGGPGAAELKTVILKILKLKQEPNIKTVLDLSKEPGFDGFTARELLDILEERGSLSKAVPSLVIKQKGAPDWIFDESDQLRRISSELFRIMTPGTAKAGKTEGSAAALHAALFDVLNNPRNTDPKFLKNWANANARYAKYQAMKQAPFLIRAVRTKKGDNEIAEMLTDLSNPALADNLNILQNIMSEKTYGNMKDILFTEWMSNPKAIVKALSATNQVNLQRIFSKKELGALNKIASAHKKMEAIGIEKAADNFANISNAVRQIVMGQNDAKVVTLAEMLNRTGGLETPAGRTVRAAIFDDLFRIEGRHGIAGGVVQEQSGGFTALHFGRLSTAIKNLERSGVWKNLLTEQDRVILRDFRRVQDMLRLSEDAGTSMLAASQQAKIFTEPFAWAKMMVQQHTIGKLFTWKTFQDQIVNPNRKRFERGSLSVGAGAMLALAATDAEDLQGPLGNALAMALNIALPEGFEIETSPTERPPNPEFGDTGGVESPQVKAILKDMPDTVWGKIQRAINTKTGALFDTPPRHRPDSHRAGLGSPEAFEP